MASDSRTPQKFAMKLTTEKKAPSFGHALFIMIAVFAVIVAPALILGSKINALFLISWMVAIILCLTTGTSYKELQAGLVANCSKAIVPAMIVLCVGALVGTWNAAGTVPLILSFGMQVISPKAFLAAAFILSTVTALITGTSWGTFGTAGLALAGIGATLNIDPVLTAGAVCSGAFFGDTISPMSDSPNIASAVSNVDLFEGIRFQAKVTVPSAVICIILYYIVGLRYSSGTVNYEEINSVVSTIQANFHTGIIALLPAVFLVVLLVMKVPSIPSILGGALFGGFIAIVYQGRSLSEVISFLWNGYSIDSGSEFVDKLLNRGGVTSMSSTALMFFFAFGLFGILNAAGVVDAVVAPAADKLKSKMSLVIATLFMSVLGTFLGASMNFAYAFAGSIMEPVYEKRHLDKRVLMRALGVGCTAMAVLVPWSLSSAVAAPFLSVSAAQLIPYNFFLFVTPIFLLIWTVIGRDTRWTTEQKDEVQKKNPELQKG